MKRLYLSVLALAAFALLPASLTAQASISANVFYSETDLGNGSWQYDYTFQSTSSLGDSHPYLQAVKLLLGGSTTITVLSLPSDWTGYTFDGNADIGASVITDYLEMYSDKAEADAAPGSSLGGFSFMSSYKLGSLEYEAIFSDHALDGENFTSTSGMTSPVPIPGAFWLLGSGLAGVVGLRRRFVRQEHPVAL